MRVQRDPCDPICHGGVFSLPAIRQLPRKSARPARDPIQGEGMLFFHCGTCMGKRRSDRRIVVTAYLTSDVERYWKEKGR